MLLADLGADVIKVEETSKGDDTSWARLSIHVTWYPDLYAQGSWNVPSAPILDSAPLETSHLPPESAYFLAVNRNKRSITVNFKSPEGLEILHRMIKQSDVLVENFVSGKLASMGLGWEDCKKINPRLIYASITGEDQAHITTCDSHNL
jgi:succinate--hydroxymethylglutarate CoA-transferase